MPLLFGIALASASAASPNLLKLSDDQMRKSGIALERIASSSTAGDGLRLSGNAVFPAKAVQVISASAAGVVQAVLTEPLDKVAAGAPLVRIHSPQLMEWQRSYVQASVQAQLARTKYQRDEALFKEGIIAESRLQEARSALVQSSVAEQEQRQALKIAGMGDKDIRKLAGSQAISPILTVAAPSAGTIIEQMAAPGQRVEAGAPLAKIAQSNRLWLELQAARAQAAQIAVGDAVSVEGCPKPGRISAVGMQVDSATQNIILRAELPSAESCLRPNQFVEAIVKPGRAQAGTMEVPSAALVRFEGKDYVFVRTSGGFRPAEVTVASRGAERAAVQGALKAGDEIAVRGVSTLKGMWLGLGGSGEGK
ncbi:MAG TPA: efflux RND transporter periplasmic adaptor subunit [Noviherbaspirillum sp.]|uniref:efflux RND transporter periplasmic adaptor subunit n=1 Tax=Noviherbaspirillum sp. TaxID=1926288 RepID=UPI002B480570|nr:efflux RND transporter periplasmic adaptor subunit [Noviherbaspirillum sp.]HJV87446.1 efflux RND transporter periplasmic adaptor subunit [Noviherbaspirillum sp.]